MTDRVQLECSVAAYERLIAATHKAKNGTETIRVKVADLEALLIDHGRLLRAHAHTFKEGGR